MTCGLYQRVAKIASLACAAAHSYASLPQLSPAQWGRRSVQRQLHSLGWISFSYSAWAIRNVRRISGPSSLANELPSCNRIPGMRSLRQPYTQTSITKHRCKPYAWSMPGGI